MQPLDQIIHVKSLIFLPVLILEATYPIKKHYHWHPSTTTVATTTSAPYRPQLFHPVVVPPNNHHQHHQFVTSQEHNEAEMVL